MQGVAIGQRQQALGIVGPPDTGIESRADLGPFGGQAIDPSFVERPGAGVRKPQIGLHPLEPVGQLRRDQAQALVLCVRMAGNTAIARQLDAPPRDQCRIGDRRAEHGGEFADTGDQGILGALDGIEAIEE